MINPTFPKNIEEIPNITFLAIKEHCNQTRAITQELTTFPQKDLILKENPPLQNKMLSGELLFKELGVDYCV